MDVDGGKELGRVSRKLEMAKDQEACGKSLYGRE